MKADVAVVGAGPAGLAAAAAAADCGASVVLIDAYARLGGQYFKQPAAQLQLDRERVSHDEPELAQRLISAVEQHPRMTVLSNTSIWSASRLPDAHEFILRAHREETPQEIRARALVLAPGAYERVLPFPGWDLPGVMTAGAAQTLLKNQGILPGRRILVSGSGPFLLPVAVQLVKAGAEVVGIFEAMQQLALWRMLPALLAFPGRFHQLRKYLGILQRAGVRMYYGRAVTCAEGDGRVERVQIARLDRDWDRREVERTVAVEAVCCSFGFLPQTDLAEQLGCDLQERSGGVFVAHDESMGTSVERVFVAGEITAIRGAHAAIAQGEVAGIEAALSIGAANAANMAKRRARAYAEFKRNDRFAEAITRSFRIGSRWHTWLDDSTTICRCEDVSYECVHRALSTRAVHDLRSTKAQTRCGMGLCQARICGAYLPELLAAQGRSQGAIGRLGRSGIATPVPLGVLAKHTSTGSATGS
jgi:NADPH-dependent 2,4-dienoyl-CoA reductase/sulfur reductase-like enzyme